MYFRSNSCHRLLFVSLLVIGTTLSFAQTITKDFKNEPLKKVLKEVERQTNYSIIYKKGEIDENRRITGRFQKSTLEETLNTILGDKIEYKLQNKLIILSPKHKAITKASYNTNRKITGKVVGADNEPIIGATLKIKGKNTGAITNVDGVYVLDAEDNDLITISYIGFESKTLRANQLKNNGTTVLTESSQSLNELVVIGYGSQKKINLTGAVAVVQGKEMAGRPSPRSSQMLQGLVPNMNITFSSGYPGVSPNINIRGVNSISGGSPLILIDGIEGNIDRINPNDIESISVLKDTSSAAIYGARASYGVILVTTKNGASEKPTVNYDGRFSWSSQTTSTDYETRGYYSAGINDLFYSNYAGKPYTNYTEDDYKQLWARRNDKTEQPERPWVVTDQRDGKETYIYYANFDWYNHLFRKTRPMWEHNVSINGGNKKTNYYLSANTASQTGIFKQNPDHYLVYNIRGKLGIQLTDKIHLTNNTKYHYDSYSYPGLAGVNNTFNGITNHGLASFVPTNPDGSIVCKTSLNNEIIMDGVGAILEHGKHNNKDRRHEFSNTIELSWNVLKGLNLHTNYSIVQYNYITKNRTVNIPYSHYPGETQTLTTGSMVNKLTENHTNHTYRAFNVYGDYQFDLDGHQFKMMGGYNFESKKLKDTSASRQGLLSDDLDDFNLATGDVMNINGGQNEYAIVGLFYRLNYSFKNGRYLMETSGRYDGTSRFQKGHRFGFFPSASAGWRISEEPFFKHLKKTFSNVKLRVSYGALGNQQVGYYDYIQTINTNRTMSYLFGDQQMGNYASVSDPNSADLTWEKVSTANIGLDLGMLNNKLNLNFDAYIRDTKGMQAAGKKLPAVYGAKSPKQNAANLRTKGWELALTWNDSFQLQGNPFKYNFTVGVADNTSEITKYDNPSRILNDYYEGQKLGDIWGYVVDGYFLTDEEATNYEVDQTAVNSIINSSQVDPGVHAGDLKFVDLDGDKKISIGANTADHPGDRRIIGNALPRYTYSLQTGASWAGFDISVFFQGVGKQNWYPGQNALGFWGPYSRPYASFISSTFLKDVWSPDNPNAYFPRPRGYIALKSNRSLGAVNTKYLQNLAYCRIKNITMGYTLPAQLTNKVGVERIRIYFSGENLFTFTALRSKYIDPEQASAQNSIRSGSSTAKLYPWSKTYSFGLSVTF